MSSTVAPSSLFGPPPEPIKRVSVEEYHAMIRSGVFDDDDPIELLDGWLAEKMPEKPAHSAANGLLVDAIAALLPTGWHVISQEPITTLDSEPEPDLAVVRGKRRDYLDSHPRAADVALVVEVADTTLARDRGVKKDIYARAGIPAYWIVNLVDRRVEVLWGQSSPAGKRPRRERIFGPDDLVPLVLDSKTIGKLEVKLLLP
jgi:Uma2 family endonuclease